MTNLPCIASLILSLKRNSGYIKKKGYWAWYHKNEYGRRNKVENTFYRLKTIFGRKLHLRNWNNQQAEAHLICRLLNKMTQAGMPKSVKAAWKAAFKGQLYPTNQFRQQSHFQCPLKSLEQ